MAGKAACPGDLVFLPRDESSAWAWLPLGIRDTFDPAEASGVDPDVRFAFGNAAKGAAGFRLTHRQALAAQAVALAAGSPAPQAVTFGEVAPIAMMLGTAELLRPWVLSTLAGLAADDEHHARLRETLLVFLQTGGSYKTTAEQLMLHKNTVQCRSREPPARQKPVAISPLPSGVGQRPGAWAALVPGASAPLVRPVEWHRSTARRTG